MKESREISDLHLVLQRGVKEFIKRCKSEGLNIRITQTLRDSEYQDWLYAKGRTSGGSIVTNARGGNSFHNYGLAFDICKNIKGKEYSDLIFFHRCGQIWEDMGGKWGGNFKSFKDNPHFEFTNGLSTKDLRNGKKLSKDAKMEWENMSVIKNKFIVEGIETELNTIFYEDKNYIELRELSKLGLIIDYDKIKKMPIIKNS